jgi:hypothetical protein
MAARRGPWACTGRGRAARPGMFAACAAWSAREIELQALATLAALAQILHTVCRSFPKISSALSAKVCGGSKLAKILKQCVPPHARPTHTLQRSEARSQDRSPALLDGCNGLRTRSLNHRRQGSLPTALLHLESGANGFRQSGCDRSTILARARFQPCKRRTVDPLRVQTDHPSPSAR